MYSNMCYKFQAYFPKLEDFGKVILHEIFPSKGSEITQSCCKKPAINRYLNPA